MKKLYFSLITAVVFCSTAHAQTVSDITDADLVGGQTYNWTKNNIYSLEGTVYVEDGANQKTQSWSSGRHGARFESTWYCLVKL